MTPKKLPTAWNVRISTVQICISLIVVANAVLPEGRTIFRRLSWCCRWISANTVLMAAEMSEGWRRQLTEHKIRNAQEFLGRHWFCEPWCVCLCLCPGNWVCKSLRMGSGAEDGQCSFPSFFQGSEIGAGLYFGVFLQPQCRILTFQLSTVQCPWCIHRAQGFPWITQWCPSCLWNIYITFDVSGSMCSA